MDDYSNLKTKVHRYVLDLRSIELIIQSPTFERIYVEAEENDKKWIDEQIRRGEKDALRSWIKCHPSFDLMDRGTRYLKELAQKHQVTNWSRLGKIQLVEEIKKKEEQYNVLKES